MNKEYWLIRTLNGRYTACEFNRGKEMLIDKVIAKNIKEAERVFFKRNKRTKNTHSFIIVKSERWY